MSRFRFAGKLETASGRVVDVRNFDVSDVRWDEICHALSNLARYQGHSLSFFSVLSHSVLSYLIAKRLWPEDLDLQIAVLIHDAAEAYIGDMIRPIRALPGMYVHKKYERAIMAKILEAAKLDPGFLDDERVKIADNLALAYEVISLMPSGGQLDIWKPFFKTYELYHDKFRLTWLDWLKVNWFARRTFLKALEKHYARKLDSGYPTPQT